MNRVTPDVWRDVPIDRHFWAFYYFCKRCGDRVWFRGRGRGQADLYVVRRS